MQCPVCKKQTLESEELIPGLAGKACRACAGTWIPRHNYDAWRRKQPGELPEKPAPVQIAVTESHQSKICPDCGRLLLPYRVGHGLSFSIDYCGACGGVWMDTNEWSAIKAKNLHDNLLDIVSEHWQSAVHQVDVQDVIEQRFKRLLGPDYAKAAETRAWLRSRTQKAVVLAYLADNKPETP